MDELITKVTTLLITHFTGKPGHMGADAETRIELEETVPGERVGGSLIWAGFTGMDQLERQNVVRRFLKQSLPPDDYLSVGLLLTFTPEEAAAMEEALAA